MPSGKVIISTAIGVMLAGAALSTISGGILGQSAKGISDYISKGYGV